MFVSTYIIGALKQCASAVHSMYPCCPQLAIYFSDTHTVTKDQQQSQQIL